MSRYILTLDCADREGIVARVSTCLAEHGGNIEDASQFNDSATAHFFMRVVFSCADAEAFAAAFRPVAHSFGMHYRLTPEGEKTRTLILVSQADHCLNDILYRWRTGHLDIDIAGVFSNHEKNRGLTESHGLPYIFAPSAAEDKSEHEAALIRAIEDTGAELIVLARYMQVLSDTLAARYAGRIINIHHSFLPGFKGAKPYHQAWTRGVKIMGATAHFVTADLDEGPIIEQETVRITHAMTAGKMQVMGKDNESRVLSRAIQLYAERRIFLSGTRTVIL